MVTTRKEVQIHLNITNRGRIKNNNPIDHEDQAANQIPTVGADLSQVTSLEVDKIGLKETVGHIPGEIKGM